MSLVFNGSGRIHRTELINGSCFPFFRGPTVRCLKGYTNIAVGIVTTEIVAAVLDNSQKVLPVSTLIQV